MRYSVALTISIATMIGTLGCADRAERRVLTMNDPQSSRVSSTETTASDLTSEAVVIPVVQEELRIDTRQRETGRVRLTKTVQERDVPIAASSIQEEVQIEHLPVNRFIAEPISVRYEGDTMIIPIMEEVVVVEKRLRLKEEVRVTKRQVTTPVNQTIRLRSEELNVERLAPRSEAYTTSSERGSRTSTPETK